MSNISQHGLIVIGYQGIGKSTYACAQNRAIDLESSNFKVDGERADDWYVIYCRIAIALAKQGYIVFTSSHQVVIAEFKKYDPSSQYDIVIIAPHSKLESEWIEKLRTRWKQDVTDDKNDIAYQDALANFNREIQGLAMQTDIAYIPITNMNYNFEDIITGLYYIYLQNSKLR